MPVGDTSEVEGWEGCLRWPSAFAGLYSSFWREVNYRSLALREPWPWLPCSWWEITDLIQNEMVFWDTRFFLLVNKMHNLEQSGLYCSVLPRYVLILLMGQSNILSLSPSTKSASDSIVNYSKHGSHTQGFWVLAMKSGRNEKVQDLHPFKWRTQ